GGDVHDRPGSAAAHAWQDETDHRDGTEEVDLELSAVVLFALLLDGAEKVDAGVVDEHIDPAEAGFRVLDRGEPLLWLRHVQSHRERRVGEARGETAHAVHRSLSGAL